MLLLELQGKVRNCSNFSYVTVEPQFSAFLK